MISKSTSLLVTLILASAISVLFNQKPPLKQQIESEKRCLAEKIRNFSDTLRIENDTITVR